MSTMKEAKICARNLLILLSLKGPRGLRQTTSSNDLKKNIAAIQDFVFEHKGYTKYRTKTEQTTQKDGSNNLEM